MAITPALFNSLIFGGIDSADYGIYINGEGVFNAPVRAVEMIQVPGRNGDISLDLGRYENITVEYPAGVYGEDGEDFREKLSDFRNAILSQKGYQRLQDTYHPDEFRMGVYMEGLEVAPVNYNTAGEFVLKFNCKPQRFLVSGENDVTIQSGDTIINPTLLDSQPLIKVWGYGGFNINGQTVTIQNDVFGRVYPASVVLGEKSAAYIFENNIASGDTLIIEGAGVKWNFANKGQTVDLDNYGVTGIINALQSGWWQQEGYLIARQHNTSKLTFSKGTPDTKSGTYWAQLFKSGVDIGTITFTLVVEYDGDSTIKMSSDWSTTSQDMFEYATIPTIRGFGSYSLHRTEKPRGIYADSTMSVLGTPTLIDCETGEAVKEVSGQYVSLNKYVNLGADIPLLTPGNNTVTFDNTITNLKISPRWWKL